LNSSYINWNTTVALYHRWLIEGLIELSKFGNFA